MNFDSILLEELIQFRVSKNGVMAGVYSTYSLIDMVLNSDLTNFLKTTNVYDKKMEYDKKYKSK